MTSDSFSEMISAHRQRIDEALTLLVQHKEPSCLYEPIRYVFLGKGKRLRPTLVLLVAKMFKVSESDAMPAALATEILHNFSLVHDDIMDQDAMRHSLETVYRKWDESTAILAGDAIFALAYSELAKVKTNPLACIVALNDAALKLCEGQALDKEFESRDDVTLKEYLTMVKLKTGTLLSLCCRLGAIMGNANHQEQNALAEFGELLGQGFQIQDDALEIFSNSENMGKSLGSDIVARKKTYLTCWALEHDGAGWRNLLDSIRNQDLQSRVLPSLRTYFEDSGVAAKARNQARELISLSRSKIAFFGERRRKDLEDFVTMVMNRKK